MLETEKWTKDKSALVVIFVPQAAAIARDIPDILLHVRERRLFDYQFPQPDLPSWSKLYHTQEKSFSAVRNLIVEFSNFARKLVAFGQMIKDLKSSEQKSPEGKLIYPVQKVEEVGAALKDLVLASYDELRENFSNTPFDTPTKERFLKAAKENENEIGFFFLVYAPCWLLFLTSPNRLYRKARRGDVAALENLINLDPLMLHDAAIGREVQKLRLNNRTNDYERLLDAARKPLKGTLTSSKAKTFIAGFIHFISGVFKNKLKEPQIRKLLDAVNQDAGGDEIDTEIHDDPEIFARNVRRKSQKLRQTFKTDKKK
jgi:hypothetical protein